MARPRLQVDEQQVIALAAIQCTWEEMELVLRVNRKTLERRFGHAIAEGRAKGKTSLRRKQYEVAMDGNANLLVWLGKQYLDQRDKKDIEDLHFKDKHEAIQKLEEALAKLKAEVKS